MTSREGDRKLGPFLAMMLTTGGMIGSGIYLLPASLGAIGSISILGWCAAVVSAALIGGVFCCLAILRPNATGLFSYIHEAFGPGAGFVAAFLYWVTCPTAAVAVALAATGYLSVFVPAVAKQPGETIATLGFIWLLVGANYIGPRFVARTQSWTIAIGLVPVFFVAIGGWFFFHAHIFAASWNVTGQSFLQVVPRSTVMAFWAFLGIETAIVLAPLVRNPARDVPIATLGGLALASAIYIAACAAIMGILPASVLAKSSAPFADAVAPVLGASVAAAVALFAMFKAVGTLGATVLLTVETADSQAMLGQVRDPSYTRPFGRASGLHLFVTGAFMSLIVLASISPTLARQFTIVTDVTVVVSVLVYLAACLALLRLGTGMARSMRIWSSLLATAASVFCIALIWSSESDLLIWSAAATVIAVLAYVPVRTLRPVAPAAIPG